MGFQSANGNEFHGFGNLVIWLWEVFGNIVKGVCMNPEFLQTLSSLYEPRAITFLLFCK